MAFLVCYSKLLSDHVNNNAIYLDQQFYELIFHHCRHDSSGFTALRQIAQLRYKSPTILFGREQLAVAVAELEQFENANCHHAQIQEFKNVCHLATKNSDNLTISGDMHPELDDSFIQR